MARTRQSQPFTIFDDSGIPTPEPEHHHDADCTGEDLYFGEGTRDADHESDHHIQVNELAHDEAYHGEVAPEGEDARRESAITSISSLHSSPTDNGRDGPLSMHQPYTPPIIRPSFRRPESVRRMRMASPSPLGSRSPRRSVLRHRSRRKDIPGSMHSVGLEGSRGRRMEMNEEEEVEEPVDTRAFPLVLLHVTILPLRTPWSLESLHAVLPSSTMEDLRLLQSKLSDTILQRGILIPHPREEFEQLEERLLEALELKQERVTKCGHFRRPARDSIDESDSGLGTSSDDLVSSDDDCETCHQHLKLSPSKVHSDGTKWSVKVYAANGLMRAPAWAAAWEEMESVDVEIMPWISEEAKKALDERLRQDEAMMREKKAEEQRRMKAALHEEMQRREEQMRAADAAERSKPQTHSHSAVNDSETVAAARKQQADPKASKDDLPQIYRPSEIPLSVLLKNYAFLLAQDSKNVAIFVLILVAFVICLRSPPAKLSNHIERWDDLACGGVGKGTAMLGSGLSNVVAEASNATQMTIEGKWSSGNVSAEDVVLDAGMDHSSQKETDASEDKPETLVLVEEVIEGLI